MRALGMKARTLSLKFRDCLGMNPLHIGLMLTVMRFLHSRLLCFCRDVHSNPLLFVIVLNGE